MEIKDISRASLKGVDDKEVVSLHHRVHQLFGSLFNGQIPDDWDTPADSITFKDLAEAHRILVAEMKARAMIHNYVSALDNTLMTKNIEVSPAYFDNMNEVDLADLGELADLAKNVMGQNILDVGCGTGRVMRLFKRAGYNIKGCDIHPIALRMAAENGMSVEPATAECLPYEDDSFDTVYSVHVLEHLDDPVRAIAESLRVGRLRVIHIVPIGKCADKTHKHIFKSIDELYSIMKDFTITKHIASTGTYGQNAVIIFYKDMSLGHHILDKLDDFVIVPNFINIVGGSLKLSNPSDLDILVRSDYPNQAMEIKLVRQVSDEIAKAMHLIYNSSGPHDDHIPLYDLVARKKPMFEVNRISKAALEPLQRFTPLKTASGYTMQEFFSEKDFWDYWARGFIDEGIALDVEQKFNGLRTVLESDTKGTLIFFEDSKTDRTKQFPSLVDDLKSIGEPIILDSDLGAIYANGDIVERKALAALTTENLITSDKGEFETGDGLKATVLARVFDVLYYNDEDLHDKPWTERRKVLEEIFGKHDFKFMKLAPKHISKSKADLLSTITKLAKIPGSEGAVVKAVNSPYPLTGQTTSWAKLKNHLEIKVVVLDKLPVKGSTNVYNYEVGYLGKDNKIHRLGKTFNTKVNVKPGDYLTLMVEEIVPKKEKDGWSIGAVVPKVADVDVSGRKNPENIESIISRAFRANILQANPDMITELKDAGLLSSMAKYIPKDIMLMMKAAKEGQIDFKEGDEGTGILQVHERGLSQDQAKLLGSDFYFGWEPVELSESQFDRLGEILIADWKGAVSKAAEGTSQDLAKLVAKINKEDLSEAQRKLIALVEPVSVHTDFRLRPKGVDYWEGGEGFTPGNQFKENKFKVITPDFKILGNFKTGREEEVSPKNSVVKGPIVWMSIGKGKPHVIPPGSVGATTDAWARFKIVDSFNWKAGVQDDHFKEFWFEGGGQLKGRWIFQYVPTAPGVRQWMIARPAKQDMKSELFKKTMTKQQEADSDKLVIIPILKADTKKRVVLGIVLKPDEVDAQGEIYDAETIEGAAYRFMLKFQDVGIQHVDFTKTNKLRIVESYLAPVDFIIKNKKIRKGTWLIAVKVFDDRVWKKIEDGELNAFSVGGKSIGINLAA